MDQTIGPARWRWAIPEYLRRDLAVVVGFNLLFAMILVAIPPGPATLVAPSLSVLGTLGAILGIALRGQRWPIRREDWFAVLLVIGGVALVGGLIVALASMVLFDAPMRWPTPTDVMRLVAYPIVFVAIFALPTGSVPTVVRARIIFDGMMIVVAITTANWYFVAGPRTLDAHTPVIVTLFANIIPLLDVLALLSLIFVAFHFRERRYRSVFVLFSLTILFIAIGDSYYGAQLMSGSSTPNPWVIFGWSGGWMVGAVGARASRFVAPEEPRTSLAAEPLRSPPLWGMVLPYGLVVLVGSLAFVVGDMVRQSPLVIGVDVGFGGLLLIVLIRQALVEVEIRRLDQDLVAANRRLAALSTTDPLTDLPNHRALVDVIDREIERARRFRRTLGLVFCDLDHFKDVNDTRGHAVGDAVLREFGDLVRHQIRGNDVIGRWGGEEFLIVLPESDAASAGRLAERLRGAVAAYQFKGISFQLTCSMGVAVFPTNATTSSALVDKADWAMYQAKALGRNQIQLAMTDSEAELPR